MRQDSRHIVLIWLLLGALLLSMALNCYLVLPHSDTDLIGWLDADDDDDDDEMPVLPNATEELRLTRAMLARCQAEHLRKDSLLINNAMRAPTKTSQVAAGLH